MGLLTGLITLPLAPVRAAAWTTRQLLEAAQQQQREELHQQLRDLEQDLRDGVLSEDEFDRREDELLAAVNELSTE